MLVEGGCVGYKTTRARAVDEIRLLFCSVHCCGPESDGLKRLSVEIAVR